jgi:hypothetical protein
MCSIHKHTYTHIHVQHALLEMKKSIKKKRMKRWLLQNLSNSTICSNDES